MAHKTKPLGRLYIGILPCRLNECKANPWQSRRYFKGPNSLDLHAVPFCERIQAATTSRRADPDLVHHAGGKYSELHEIRESVSAFSALSRSVRAASRQTPMSTAIRKILIRTVHLLCIPRSKVNLSYVTVYQCWSFVSSAERNRAPEPDAGASSTGF